MIIYRYVVTLHLCDEVLLADRLRSQLQYQVHYDPAVGDIARGCNLELPRERMLKFDALIFLDERFPVCCR